MANSIEVLTIGHSTLSYERFLELLRQSEVTAVADVRSSPYSRHFPQFNQAFLRDELRLDRISYVFLGDELGGRPKDKKLYCEGVADYEKMARTPAFSHGIGRVIEGAKKYKIAMMCSEHDPLDCHRCLLVGRELKERGVTVKHILSNGRVISHSDVEQELMKLAGRKNKDLFESPERQLALAYRDRAMKVAFTDRGVENKSSIAAE